MMHAYPEILECVYLLCVEGVSDTISFLQLQMTRIWYDYTCQSVGA